MHEGHIGRGQVDLYNVPLLEEGVQGDALTKKQTSKDVIIVQ